MTPEQEMETILDGAKAELEIRWFKFQRLVEALGYWKGWW